MKKIIFINGTMGSGKTTVSQCLKQQLPNAVFLDGDWCWDMDPFVVNASTQEMVLGNISYLLNAFIQNEQFEHIIFCWVMHEQAIIDDIVARLTIGDNKLHYFTLIVEEEQLRKQIEGDIASGKRSIDVLERAIERLPLYATQNTQKIHTTSLSPHAIAELITRSI